MDPRQDSPPTPNGTTNLLEQQSPPESIVADSGEEDGPVSELTRTQIEEELEAHYGATLSVWGALAIILGVVVATILTPTQASSTAVWTWLITIAVVVIVYGMIRRLLFPLWESAPDLAVRMLWFHARLGLASSVTHERLAELLTRRAALYSESTPGTKLDPSEAQAASRPFAPDDKGASGPPPGVPAPFPLLDRLLGLVRWLGKVKLETLVLVPMAIFGLIVIISALLEALGFIPPGLFGPGW